MQTLKDCTEAIVNRQRKAGLKQLSVIVVERVGQS